MDLYLLPAGSLLPSQKREPISRQHLALYAEASGDINPIHLDEEAAKKAGLTGVIAHGMLSMAHMCEYVYGFLNNNLKVETFSCRFRAKTYPGDVITLTGLVKNNDGQRIALNLETRNQDGVLTATGQASILIIT